MCAFGAVGVLRLVRKVCRSKSLSLSKTLLWKKEDDFGWEGRRLIWWEEN